MKTFIPRDYQYSIISRIIDNDRCAIYAGMGMGKTSSTLCAIEFLKLTEGHIYWLGVFHSSDGPDGYKLQELSKVLEEDAFLVKPHFEYRGVYDSMA